MIHQHCKLKRRQRARYMDCYVLDDGLSHDDDTRYATALRRSARIEICDPRDGEDFPFPVSRYALPYNWTVGLS